MKTIQVTFLGSHLLDKDWKTCLDDEHQQNDQEHSSFPITISYKESSDLSSTRDTKNAQISVDEDTFQGTKSYKVEAHRLISCNKAFPDNSDQASEYRVCPPLFPPLHGYHDCSRPINFTNNSERLKIKNVPGSTCTLKCPESFRLVGKFEKFCDKDGKWLGEHSGICLLKSSRSTRKFC